MGLAGNLDPFPSNSTMTPLVNDDSNNNGNMEIAGVSNFEITDVDNNNGDTNNIDESTNVDDSNIAIPSSNNNEEENEAGREKKRGRGRPPGSKNKPKTPASSSSCCGWAPASGVEHQLLEVEAGGDVITCLATYARSCGRAVAILHASGFVSGFRIHNQANSSLTINNNVTELIALSGTVFPTPNNSPINGLTATMLYSSGYVFGGRVQGPLVAQSTISMLVTTFSPMQPTRLPSGSGSGSGSGYYLEWTHDRMNGTSTGAALEQPYAWAGQSQNALPN